MTMEPPKVTKKGDQVITNYVDEKTGKFTAYEVGVKLEVSDFSGQWFPAKIVEVDNGEKEVLVHFENWSARFDEWIKMDSNRLRPSPNTNIVKTHFKVGEHVEALWNTDGQRYPGVIQNVLPNDYYQVLFDDGIKLKKKYNQIFKLKASTRKAGGAGSSKKYAGDPIPMTSATGSLPELTSFPSTSSETAAKKSNALQPPALLPNKPAVTKAKPKVSGTVDSIPDTQESSLFTPPGPKKSAPKKSRKKAVQPLPVPSPSPPVLSTPEVLSPVTPSTPQSQDTSPASPTKSDDGPVSSKRKRTVQDYSDLLRIRRRYQYQKETGGGGEPEKFKRPRRSRTSPFASPPELFPETGLPLPEEPQTTTTEVELAAETKQDVGIEPKSELDGDENVTIATPPASPLMKRELSEPKEQEQEILLETESEFILPDSMVENTADVDPLLPVPVKPKPKPKRKFRPFNTSRRKGSKKQQRIIYVTVDDEEFAAAGGNLNPRKSRPGKKGTLELTGSEPIVADGDSSAPSTPASSVTAQTDGSLTPTASPATDGTGLRIIKRRRRRTYAKLAAEGIGVETGSAPTTMSPNTPSTPSDEPLSKRKRTIHDYSMLLKTRPKFFFDIDAEQERPGMQPTRRRRATEASSASPTSLATPALELSSEAISSVLQPLTDPLALTGDASEAENELKPKVIDLEDDLGPAEVIAHKSEPVPVPVPVPVEPTGPTSIATHRPVRRSSSQFARKSHIAQDVSARPHPHPQSRLQNIKPTDFRIVLPEIHVVSTRGTENGLKGSSATVILENIDGKIESHAGRSAGSSGGRRGSKGNDAKAEERRLKMLERKTQSSQLGSKLITDLDYNSLEEDEELLDIGYTGGASGVVTPSTSKARAKSSATTSAVSAATPVLPVPTSSTSTASTSVTSAKKVVKRKARSGVPGNQWWKRRQSAQNARKASESEGGADSDRPVSTVSNVSKSRRSVKIKRRPGDLMSGLTLNRIRTIRSNLFKQGFRKRIIAVPASKDVSVDIISCICGSSDEHGLMVQCELCQCWQHGQCFDIETVVDMPKNYICGACLYPENVRGKKPIDYHYDFYKTGKIPRFGFTPPMQPKFSKLIQETNQLIHRLHQVRGIIHTSRVHMNLMEAKPDHPKLYQWDKPHETIRESQQERRFNKVYRPLLRRLMFFNRHDPTYVSKLRAKVEQVVNRRSVEERKRADKRINEKFPSIFPTAKPIPIPNLQKRFGPASPSPVFKTPAVPPLSPASKDAKRLEAEALRIRKELETLGKGNGAAQAMNLDTVRVKSASNGSNSALLVPKIEQDTDSIQEVKVVMEDVLSKVETMCDSDKKSGQEDLKPTCHSISPQPPSSAVVSVLVTPKKESAVQEVVDLGEEAPPEFPDMPGIDADPLEDTTDGVKCDLAMAMESADLTSDSSAQVLECSSQEAKPEPQQQPDFNDVDLMNLDPSDPKFSTIAADLVKSCCEEPESLIKTLQDLANVTTEAEPVQELEGSDHDLINFLDEALMEDVNAGPTSTNTAEVELSDATKMLPPPIPPVPMPNTSAFVVPAAPPRLTRLTPELCRGNLMLTILDQQRIIDQHLDEIEARVADIEKMRGLDSPNRAAAFHRISSLQAKVKRMMRGFELVKSIGRRAERSLREVIQEEPDAFDEASTSEQEIIKEKDNEETDSADEEGEDEELSEELEDL